MRLQIFDILPSFEITVIKRKSILFQRILYRQPKELLAMDKGDSWMLSALKTTHQTLRDHHHCQLLAISAKIF